MTQSTSKVSNNTRRKIKRRGVIKIAKVVMTNYQNVYHIPATSDSPALDCCKNSPMSHKNLFNILRRKKFPLDVELHSKCWGNHCRSIFFFLKTRTREDKKSHTLSLIFIFSSDFTIIFLEWKYFFRKTRKKYFASSFHISACFILFNLNVSMFLFTSFFIFPGCCKCYVTSQQFFSKVFKILLKLI